MKYYIRLENEKEHICQEVTKELYDKINNTLIEANKKEGCKSPL